MAFKDDLQVLVKRYADFDEAGQHYEINPGYSADERFRSHLEGELIKLISQEFTSGSPDFTEITLRYKKLSRIFHPDKLQLSPEMSWVEKMLSEGQDMNRGSCFKCLRLCYQRLDPDNREEIKFDQIKSMSDLKQWLQTQKDAATTRTQANLYTCLLQMVEQMAVHNDDSQAIKQNFLRYLMWQLPVLASSLCAYIFVEELLAVYGVCFVTLKLGQQLSRAEGIYWRQIGHKMEDISYSSALYTSSLLARVIEISFWLSNQSYHTSLSIASTLLRPMIGRQHTESSASQNAPGDSQALVLKANVTRHAYDFKTPPLKMIATHIEDYLETNAQQWFKPLRPGGEKRVQFKTVMSHLIALDRVDEMPYPEKLLRAKALLQGLLSNPLVYNVGELAPRAVDNAMKTLKWYESELESSDDELQENGAFSM